MIYKIYKLSKTDSIPLEISKKYPSKHRAIEFFTSRMALRYCLEEMGDSTFKNDLITFEIENNHHLKESSSVLVSLAHTKKECGAAIVSHKNTDRSVGIDIELKNRQIKPNTFKIFVNSADYTYPQNNSEDMLHLWAQKEAAFKALDPVKEAFTNIKTLVLKDIWITEGLFGVKDKVAPVGEVSYKEEVIENEKLIIAIAKIPLESENKSIK